MLHRLRTEGFQIALSQEFNVNAANFIIDPKTGELQDTSGQIEALITKHPKMKQIYGEGKISCF